MPALTMESGPLAGQRLEIPRSLTLGREGVDVVIDDPTVSRRHALLHRDEGSVRILDDRSLNGVFLNGERVDWHELDDGDEVVIGRFHLYFISLTGESLDGAPEGVGSAVG
jgi:pSer/pThr/pTyr-binding forkhead associated (FHA) protein